MTAFDRFDPFDSRITAAIDEIAAAHRPAYLDEVLRETAATRQRPRWTFPGRLLPLDVVARTVPGARLPMRPILLLSLIALLLAALGIAVAGALNRTPAPYGLADNGRIAYVQDGDLWVRESLRGEGVPLIQTEDVDAWPLFSPDGTRLVFVRQRGAIAEYWVADADGSDQRELLPDPIIGSGWLAWAADSRTVAVVNEVSGKGNVYLADTDSGDVERLDLGDLHARRIAWRPGQPTTLLMQATSGSATDLYLVERDGSSIRALDLPTTETDFGPDYTNSGAAWSPDGEVIAYNSVEPYVGGTRAEHFRIRFTKADGTGNRAAPGPDDPEVQESWPVWSPDGRWILVHRWTWKTDGGGQGWMAVMPADGSEPARDIGPRTPGGEDTGLIALWSPDATTVILRSENERKVYEIDPASGVWDELPWTDEMPDWQRVNRWP